MLRILGSVLVVAGAVAGCGGGSDGGSSDTTACATSAADTSTVAAKAAVLGAGDGLAARAESMRRGPSTEASPIQVRPGQQVRTASISLGALSLAASRATATQADTVGVPRQIGLARDLQQTATVAGTQSVLDWQATASGGQVAAISIDAGDAVGLRLGVLVRSLPATATLRVYTQGSSSAYTVAAQEVLATVQRNLAAGDTSDAARMFWTPMVEGTEATLEIELPANTPTDGVQIAVPRLAHIYASPTSGGSNVAKATTGIGAAESCEVDVSCTSSHTAESNAVAKITYVEGAGAYLCSGALVADTAASGSPYFLSANHCISTQTVASTLESHWFYRASSCNSGTLNTAAYKFKS